MSPVRDSNPNIGYTNAPFDRGEEVRALSGAATETQVGVRPARANAVRPPGKGYTLSRVWVPEDSRTRGNKIEVRECIVALEEALRAGGITIGVSINSAIKTDEDGRRSVMTIQVNEGVDKNTVYGIIDCTLQRMTLEYDGLEVTLVYEPPQGSSSSDNHLAEVVPDKRTRRGRPPEGTIRRAPGGFRPASAGGFPA